MKYLIQLATALLVGTSFQLAAKNAPKPNIILIMCDDMGYSDLGCYGGEIDTPNIDRLASEGLRFRQFYNNSKCTTTRASLLSGAYPARAGKSHGPLWDDQTYSVAQALKPAGYKTILTGKWHLGLGGPNAWGFDESYGLLDGCSDSFNPTIRGRKFGHNGELIKEFPDDFYLTEAYVDHAIEQIKIAEQEDQPYFMHLAFQAPHWPVQAWPEDHAKYKGKYAGGWEAMREDRYKRMIEMGVIGPEVKLSQLDAATKPWTGSEEDQLSMELHAAMIDAMDQHIGRLLDVVEASDAAENTMIIFLSDNGASAESPKTAWTKDAEAGLVGSYISCGASWANAQCTPFRKYKKFGHEGGQCTPCIIRWPKNVKPGTWSDDVAHIIDFQPTFMELAGLDPVKDIPEDKRVLDGESFASVLVGQEFTREKPIYFEWVGNRAIRDGDWKAAYLVKTKQWELFNIEEDRTEMNDLSKQHPERMTQMVKAWEAWAADHGVPLKSKGRQKKK